MKKITIFIVIVFVTVHIGIEIYNQFRLTREYNFKTAQWCLDRADRYAIQADARLATDEFLDKLITNCKNGVKEKWQLPMRENHS